ncbi:DUF7521 family protein [Halorarius halobius]|uniref:DUF7521 family protein n=1 Tax=Halorarius halobius TaxID=2962671 RepID=UPI0020CBBED3|nr:hypothetical protein [Halorarius halobius]
MVSVSIAGLFLGLMRLVLFGLSLGLTVISFQAYRKNGSERLQYAFVGFAFISMGVAVTNLNTQLLVAGGVEPGGSFLWFQIAETVPFSVGFAMIYLSLYR